jgi:PAS domain S-box-containing protein
MTSAASAPAESLPRISLARRTLRNVAVRISVVVAIATVVSFWHVRSGIERQAVEGLERYIEQRRGRESAVFDIASGNVETFAGSYAQAIRQTDAREAEQRFASLFESRPDGTTRLTRDVFDQHGVTGFIGKHVTVDRDLKRRLVTAFDLVVQFGPAWARHAANLYVVSPEGAVVMYWPGQPWALEAADWEVSGKLALLSDTRDGVVVAGAAAGVPVERQRWSDLYFDYGVNDWLVSVTRPVVGQGRHLISVGSDILLHDLIERAIQADPNGTYNFLFSEDGRLIAHPYFMEAIKARSGSLRIQETGDPTLERIFNLSQERRPGQPVLNERQADSFLAVSSLSGPGWLMATVFPRSIAISQAWNTARMILLLGVLALVLEIVILGTALRKQITAPLRKLIDATGSIASGSFGQALDIRRDDEIGALAAAFTTMSREVDARETALVERGESLARLNRQLACELEERKRAERELARHKELNALLDSIDYGVLFLGADLGIRLANRAYCEIWAMPAEFYDRPRTLLEDMEETRSRGLYSVPDSEWEAYREFRVSEIQKGGIPPRELQLSNGRTIQYQCIALPDGGRMLTYFDITDLKRTEEALRRHLAAMEAAMDGMAILTKNQTYEYVNAAHLRIFGYTDPSEMIGKSWKMLYRPEDVHEVEVEAFSALAQTGRWSGEGIGRKRDGSIFPYEVSLTAIEGGGLICVVRDITERHARDAALQEAKRNAEEASLAKSHFLANMSHEVRTPLNAVLGYTELMLDGIYGPFPERARSVLQRVQFNGKHLLSLINDILDLSKVEAGELAVACEPYSMAMVVHSALTATEALANAKGLELRSVVPERLPGGFGDERRLTQVLLNLLGNAIKFTEKGHVEVSVRATDERFEISVADTGIGIAEADRERIFESFQQGSGAIADKAGGTGLGLAISKRIVELHGGSISVRSEVGQGSTFVIDLPIRLGEMTEAA